MWTAAWFWPLRPDTPAPPTQELFNTLKGNPSALPADTRDLVDAEAEERRLVHFELAFPEVFTAERGGFDVCLGNPPYLGGMKISGTYGDKVNVFLKASASDAPTGGRVDLAAYFLRRGFDLLRPGGSLSFVTTNTVAEGDTRNACLVPITAQWGGELVNVVRSQPWTGEATVSVAVLHLHRGAWTGPRTRDGVVVERIPADFGGDLEAPVGDPLALPENEGRGFLGANLMATGFELTAEERERLLLVEPEAAEVVKAFYGGRDIMNRPDPEIPVRWVIDFGARTLEEAASYPEALAWVRERVKPQRDSTRDARMREKWWRFGRPGAALQQAITANGLSRVIAIPEVSKHLRPVWLPAGAVYQHKLGILTFDDDATFGVVASSVFWLWVTKRCATMRVDPSFNPARDFGTMVRPSSSSTLAEQGAEFEQVRREVAAERRCGITRLYNKVDDPGCGDRDITKLRAAQQDLDRAVATAYGWGDLDISLGHYPTERFGERWTLPPAIQQEVDRRLLALNHSRAAVTGSDGDSPRSLQ